MFKWISEAWKRIKESTPIFFKKLINASLVVMAICAAIYVTKETTTIPIPGQIENVLSWTFWVAVAVSITAKMTSTQR